MIYIDISATIWGFPLNKELIWIIHTSVTTMPWHLAEVPSKKGTEGVLCQFNKGTLCPAKFQVVRATHRAKQWRERNRGSCPCTARAESAPGRVGDHILPRSMPRGTALTRNWFIASNRCTYAVSEPRRSCSCCPKKTWRLSLGSCILSLLLSLKSRIFVRWLMRSDSLKEFPLSQGNWELKDKHTEWSNVEIILYNPRALKRGICLYITNYYPKNHN